MPQALISLRGPGERIPDGNVKEFLKDLGPGAESMTLTGQDPNGVRVLARAAAIAGSLATEVLRLRSLLDRIYDLVDIPKGTEELQADLEREVMAVRAERRG